MQKVVALRTPQAYITGLMKLNQDYVKSEVAYQNQGKKRDPEAIEELDKQLHYMERTIAALRTNTSKNETRIRIENNIKTKENTHLIDDLNRLKFENKKQHVILQKKKNEYETLEAQQAKLVRERNMVFHEYNQMLQTKEQRAHSATMRDAEGERVDGHQSSSKLGRPASTAARSTNEQQKQDEADKGKVSELNGLIEANNAEIMENWKKISYIKGKIRQTIEAKLHALRQPVQQRV